MCRLSSCWFSYIAGQTTTVPEKTRGNQWPARYTTLTRALNLKIIIARLQRMQGELTAWSIYCEPCRTCVSTMHMRVIRRKNGRPCVWPSKGGSARSLKHMGFRENATDFWPLLPVEYVAAFSQQTEAPEVRCDLTDRHTPTHTDIQIDTATTVTLAVDACRGLIISTAHMCTHAIVAPSE